MKTEFFNYDEMTWDAIAELPRDTPLVLPLGTGYNNELGGVGHRRDPVHCIQSIGSSPCHHYPEYPAGDLVPVY